MVYLLDQICIGMCEVCEFLMPKLQEESKTKGYDNFSSSFSFSFFFSFKLKFAPVLYFGSTCKKTAKAFELFIYVQAGSNLQMGCVPNVHL